MNCTFKWEKLRLLWVFHCIFQCCRNWNQALSSILGCLSSILESLSSILSTLSSILGTLSTIPAILSSIALFLIKNQVELQRCIRFSNSHPQFLFPTKKPQMNNFHLRQTSLLSYIFSGAETPMIVNAFCNVTCVAFIRPSLARLFSVFSGSSTFSAL